MMLNQPVCVVHAVLCARHNRPYLLKCQLIVGNITELSHLLAVMVQRNNYYDTSTDRVQIFTYAPV